MKATSKKIFCYQIAAASILLAAVIFGSSLTLTQALAQTDASISEVSQSQTLLAQNDQQEEQKDKYGLSAAAPDELKSEKSLGTRVGDMINIVLSFVGVGLLVLMLYGGITWMTSGGNAEKIGQAKKVMAAAIVGFILIFLSYTITKMISREFFYLPNANPDITVENE